MKQDDDYYRHSLAESPIFKWGQNMSKMRNRAFDLYEKDPEAGREKYPEFLQRIHRPFERAAAYNQLTCFTICTLLIE